MSVQLHPLSNISQIVASLQEQKSPLDVYVWYEGPQGLPQEGAEFYHHSLLSPMQNRPETKIHLYSLKAWKFDHPIAQMKNTNLSTAVERCNNAAIQCFCSSRFFTFCAQSQKLKNWAQTELPKKQWLLDLSSAHKPKGKTVAALFEHQASLLDSVKHLDVSHAYSHMQYMEGFFLVREVVAKAISQKQSSVQIAFVLPNDEDKYYRDFPQDLPKMLQAEFGDEIDTMKIDVSFYFFKYGADLHARPYLGKSPKVTPTALSSYLPPSPTILDRA